MSSQRRRNAPITVPDPLTPGIVIAAKPPLVTGGLSIALAYTRASFRWAPVCFLGKTLGGIGRGLKCAYGPPSVLPTVSKLLPTSERSFRNSVSAMSSAVIGGPWVTDRHRTVRGLATYKGFTPRIAPARSGRYAT
jgi:hypothetical protein